MNLVSYFFFIIFNFFSFGYSKEDIPKYYKCENKSGGKWVFGMAPMVCDVSSFLHEDYVKIQYEPFIYKNIDKYKNEEVRYMNRLFALIKEVANFYIEQRDPNISTEEKEVWTQAVLSIAHQESYFSHYRINEKNIKMMRGDFGHGHGIFQVDDRWHFTAINEGRAADLVLNMFYSLDEYFHGWERARKSPCIDDDFDLVARARSAYSSYNGGPKKLCRWTNSHDRWFRNDKGFYDKFVKKSWERSVSNPDQKSGIDLSCILDGRKNCRNLEIKDESTLKHPIGTILILNKETPLYSKPHNHFITNIPRKTIVQVLDNIKSLGRRYLKIQFKNFSGYILSKRDLLQISEVPVKAKNYIAQKGEWIFIKNKKHFSLNAPNGKIKDEYKKGTQLQVLDIQITGNEKSIWYKIDTDEYLYAGSIYPHLNLSDYFIY